MRPVDRIYPVTQGFGANPDAYPEYDGHPGTDIGCPSGTIVRAARTGRITHAGNMMGWPGRGLCVVMEHANPLYDGRKLESYSMHLSYARGDIVGTAVRAGEWIGLSGNTGWSTGPHLHWDTRMNGVPVDPASLGMVP